MNLCGCLLNLIEIDVGKSIYLKMVVFLKKVRYGSWPWKIGRKFEVSVYSINTIELSDRIVCIYTIYKIQ